MCVFFRTKDLPKVTAKETVRLIQVCRAEREVSCQGSVPQALEAFFESTGFEDAIRNAISIGGDSDTIGAITGGIAEAYYGIPAEIRKLALTFFDVRQLKIITAFEAKYGVILEKDAGDVRSRAAACSPEAVQKTRAATFRTTIIGDD